MKKFIVKTQLFTLLMLSVASASISCQKPADPSKPLVINAASDLRYAMDTLVGEFTKKHPDAKLEVVYGSSGKAYSQIQNGAPYDMYFSANMSYPEKLTEAGFGSGKTDLYAMGYIVIWQRKGGKLDMTKGFDIFKDESVKKIAIANPDHAPYGVAAKEALQKHKLWDKLQPQLVMGENISQTAQFVTSGSADVGIIAYSLAVAPDLKKIDGGFYKIDSADHNPLRQGFMITKKGMSHPMATAFSDYVKSSQGKAILKQYGFEVPTE